MDYEDTGTSDTNDSQAVLVIEFNNQATLKNGENKENLKISETKNTWEDKTKPQLPAIALLSPSIQPANSIATSQNCESEPDSTFAGNFESLFSPVSIHSDYLEEQPVGPGDVIDKKAEAGVCGLRNLGNTCFMSTGVQCLMATPALVHRLLHHPTPAKDSLSLQLSQLTHKIWSGQYSAVQPTDFKESLGAHYPQFKDFRQHDCQEFLALLLDGLHEQMNCSSKEKLENSETDYDEEFHTKMTIKYVPNGFCKDLSPNHNNLSKNNGYLENKSTDKNESVLQSPKIDKKFNNCVVNNIATGEHSSKHPFLINKCDNNSDCDSIVKNYKILSQPKTSACTQANLLNNGFKRLSEFEDIMKDAKTSNVNVLVTKQEANNEIKFDSDKFPRSENTRRQENFSNNSFQFFENNVTSGKRGKSTVTHYQNTVDFREGLDLKRLKVHRNEQLPEAGETDSVMDCDWDKNHRMEDERKQRVITKNLDKNFRMECERRQRDCRGAGPSWASGETQPVAEVDVEAESHWQKHLAAHKSVIVDTFQGQFKSTVVCSECNHVSVTYEPFMYLSVPLPHAMERQLSITFVTAKDLEPVQHLLTLNKQDTVANIREHLLKTINRPVSLMVIAEVLDCHIAKILDDNFLIKYINNTSRSLYAFETACFSQYADSETHVQGRELVIENKDNVESENTCTICLEEKESNMSRHVGCSCILCDSCIILSNKHYGENTLKCPVCRKELIPEINLQSVGVAPDTKPIIRMLNISLVFRLDTVGDGNNNTRTVQLFGHPRLLRLPNRLQCQQLHKAVATLIPYSQPYKIILVDGQGHHCSRCMFHSHCRGCPIEMEGPLVLSTGDCLAAMFVRPVHQVSPTQPSALLLSTINKPLSLYDCIEAFSKSETLDENNPWHCPSCKKNQCATKTLSVWRYPNYLIIYLKRFVFQDCISTKLDDKVTFPLCGLNISSNCAPYDLYACVCHVGGVSAGHYTAYTQHPRTSEWYHYNDEYVTKQQPQEDDYSSAYILFYKKRGATDIRNEDFNAKLLSSNCEHLNSM